jgi:hypothetical protein
MKQIIIGSYQMGSNNVQLVLRAGTGGDFYMLPEEGKIARIKVGADQKQWARVVNAFLHEALELEYERIGCRYEHGNWVGSDMSDFMFVATHPQFTEVVARVAELTAHALPDLAKAWKGWNR